MSRRKGAVRALMPPPPPPPPCASQDEGLWEHAREPLIEALHIRSRTLGPYHPHVALVWMMLGESFADGNSKKDAKGALEKAEEILAARCGPDTTMTKYVRECIKVWC